MLLRQKPNNNGAQNINVKPEQLHEKNARHIFVNFAEDCQPYVADVIFVLDSSVSQTAAEFSKQLDFIINFIDHIIIGKENFQIGVITYSYEAAVEITIGEFNDNVTLKEAVRKIQYR